MNVQEALRHYVGVREAVAAGFLNGGYQRDAALIVAIAEEREGVGRAAGLDDLDLEGIASDIGRYGTVPAYARRGLSQ